jgi:transaldolase
MTQNENMAELSKAGVAVWLDDLSRDRIRSGNLQSLVDEYSVVGVTTNPTIFAAAISGSDAYDDQVHAMAVRKTSVEEALRTITAADVRDTCDLLAPIAQRTGHDGRVSLEVSPGVARDTDATAAEAADLWWLVDRPNLFIKIPATQEGLAAITTSIAQGISVNVTLIFSLERYRAVMDAYLSGLEQRVQDGGSLGEIESVASFFVSRVDTEIDKRLDKAGADPSLKGKAGLANARLAYQAYEEVFSSDRWRGIAGARSPAAAPAVGLDRGEEPRPAGHPLRQRSHRPWHGEHDAGEDPEGLRRPRHPRPAYPGHLRRRHGGHESRRRCRCGPRQRIHHHRGRRHPEIRRLLERTHRIGPLRVGEPEVSRTDRAPQRIAAADKRRSGAARRFETTMRLVKPASRPDRARRCCLGSWRRELPPAASLNGWN